MPKPPNIAAPLQVITTANDDAGLWDDLTDDELAEASALAAQMAPETDREALVRSMAMRMAAEVDTDPTRRAARVAAARATARRARGRQPGR